MQSIVRIGFSTCLSNVCLNCSIHSTVRLYKYRLEGMMMGLQDIHRAEVSVAQCMF